MSRTSVLTTTYIQAFLFALLGLRAALLWRERRDRTSAVMAAATGLFGISQLISAVNSTIWNTFAGETIPRPLSITTSIISYIVVYLYMLFLAEFIKIHVSIHVFAFVATLFFAVMAIIEKPALKIVNFKLVRLNVDNPIDFNTYIGIVLAYYAVAYGLLWLAFFVYGIRLDGVARFRMLCISGGFFLFFVVIGLLPRLVFGSPSSGTIRNTLTIARYIALGMAPLLFLGFTPPDWVTNRFGARAGAAQPSTSPPTA